MIYNLELELDLDLEFTEAWKRSGKAAGCVDDDGRRGGSTYMKVTSHITPRVI